MNVLEESGARSTSDLAVRDASAVDQSMIVDVSVAQAAHAAIETASAQLRTTSATELFGSFFLGDDEFALSAHCIREVVNFPEKITAIPLSPLFLEGVFTLRGTVIPVLNLERIFSPAAPAANNTQKIAIVDFDQVEVGILFHATGEILRIRPEQRCHLQYADPTIHGVISGTIQLDDGARLLQILDPAALIRIENVPQVLALKSTGRKASNNHFHLQAERRQCVSFRVGGASFAFEMSAIQEIIEVPELKSSVMNSKLCLGRINLRGSPVAVVDFAGLLNFSGTTTATLATQRVVIARIGDVAIGLLVDSVDNIFSFFPGDILPIPLLSKTRAGMFGGCIHKEGIGEVIFLNHQEIFSNAEVAELTTGHVNLYQQEALADIEHDRKDKDKARRQVYITFALDGTYAVEIKQIREIIDFAQDMMTPPGMPAFIKGIMNLRRQMITVIDLRSLYRMPPLAEYADVKILVIERGDERFGLIVDTVENIVTVSNSDRILSPKMMRSNTSIDLGSEISEVIELPTENDGKRTLSVFEIDVFLARLTREMTAQ